jgi:hypothetical protein
MTAPPFWVRLATAAALLFGGALLGALLGPLAAPELPILLPIAVPPLLTVAGMGVWTVTGAWIAGSRWVRGRGAAPDDQALPDPDHPHELVSYPPGSGALPWALGAFGAVLGAVLGLFTASWATTALAFTALGGAWGTLMRALIARRWLAHDL